MALSIRSYATKLSDYLYFLVSFVCEFLFKTAESSILVNLLMLLSFRNCFRYFGTPVDLFCFRRSLRTMSKLGRPSSETRYGFETMQTCELAII